MICFFEGFLTLWTFGFCYLHSRNCISALGAQWVARGAFHDQCQKTEVFMNFKRSVLKVIKLTDNVWELVDVKQTLRIFTYFSPWSSPLWFSQCRLRTQQTFDNCYKNKQAQLLLGHSKDMQSAVFEYFSVTYSNAYSLSLKKKIKKFRPGIWGQNEVADICCNLRKLHSKRLLFRSLAHNISQCRLSAAGSYQKSWKYQFHGKLAVFLF